MEIKEMTHPQLMLSIEREIVFQALKDCGQNRTIASQMLGITYRQFRYAMRKCGLPGKFKISQRQAGGEFEKQWRSLRLKAFQIHGNKCQCCGAEPKTGAVLHVDHVKPRNLYPELELDITNLQILCSDCHAPKGPKKVLDWR